MSSPSSDMVPPAIPPPDGQVSNFIDPESRGPIYIAVATVMQGIATISVIVRIWARCFIQKKPWWDDAATVLALLLQVVYYGVSVWLCLNGVGTHLWDLPITSVFPLITPIRVMAALTEPCIGVTKLALLIFFFQLFRSNAITRIGSLVGIVFTLIFYTTLFFLSIFLGAAQKVSPSKVVGVLDILTNFYILLLPLPAMWTWHLTWSKKIGVAFIFCLGLGGCVISIADFQYRWALSNSMDFTSNLLNVILYNTIECCLGIICVCLPLFPTAISNGSSSPDSFLALQKYTGHTCTRKQPQHQQGQSRSRRSIINNNNCYSRVKDTVVSGNYETHLTKDSLWSSNKHTPPSRPSPTYMRKLDSYSSESISTVFWGDGKERGHSSPPGSIEVRREFRVEAERVSHAK